MLGGMGVASTALASDRDSYQDTVGNATFEQARYVQLAQQPVALASGQ